ncbi:transcription factor bHLH123 isoform X1 [Selaginella moellendorffii]|uniref:transcription factor bHLH123 isoform X1 n=1 Tax=Selaginella moellendorffii TaxID=88036 RepID=UPI000D1C9DD1|nr:transcription factor bHLH123 isoform X1 [Selaginella moellendorffii]|eukprot:XP_024520523.1 transcription factor bHLH123 isoform X1 [Selaginella moellendorffii]
MWQHQQQQQQHNSFRLDNRFVVRECEAAGLLSRADSATKLVSLATTGLDSSGWQRAAALVQSPLSANSEGSSTSTPDQCPPSPAPTFCEMPSSRNGSCNNHTRQKEMHQQHQQIAWNNLPSQSPAPKSASLLEVEGECAKWSNRADNLFDDQAHDAYGTPILNSSQGYAVDALLVCRTAELMSRSCSEDTHRSLQNPVLVSPGSRGLSSMYQVEMQVPPPVIKHEEEFFLGGRNGLVIDDKVLALQRSSTATSSSKIGNFMDLLRQADRPIPDATAAASASCSHLGQLLSGSQDTPEMWLTRSSRLPAMLSEVLPSNSAGKSTESYERNKRKPTDVDTRDRGSTVQLQEAVIPKHQDDDEPATSDRVPGLFGGVASSSSGEPELFSKRPKLENSNSFPFKMQVRKEKLGERISALQQLVSPFGKTDTASVLLEAIGYIKFLHEQVQVLSSPYMKPAGVSTTTRQTEHGKICEDRQDLRSRGLCLVPVSCTLQVANDNGADYWAPTLHGLK